MSQDRFSTSAALAVFTKDDKFKGLRGRGNGSPLIRMSSAHGGRKPWAGFGDSMVAAYSYAENRWDGYAIQVLEARGALNWASVLTDRLVTFEHRHNFGVGGQNSTQQLARIQAVVDADVDGVVYRMPINDITAGYTLAQTVANVTEICRQIIESGKHLIVLVAGPRTYVDATFAAKRSAMNEWALNVLPGLFPGLMVGNANAGLIDFTTANADPIGGLAPTSPVAITQDGVHPRQRYGCAEGAEIAALVSTIYKGAKPSMIDPGDVYNATHNKRGNRIVNGYMNAAGAGTANGGVTGQVHSGWTVNRINNEASAGAVAASKVTRSVDGNTINVQQVVITAGAASVPTQVSIYPGGATAMPAGDVSEFLARMECSGPGVTKCEIELRSGSQKATVLMGAPQDANVSYMPESWAGVVGGLTQSTDASTSVQVIVFLTVAAGSAPVTLKISEVSLKSVTA